MMEQEEMELREKAKVGGRGCFELGAVLKEWKTFRVFHEIMLHL